MKSCGIRASINRMFVASSEMLKYFLISDSGWGRQLQCRPRPLHHPCLGPRQQAEEGARHEAHKEDVDSLWVWSGVSWRGYHWARWQQGQGQGRAVVEQPAPGSGVRVVLCQHQAVPWDRSGLGGDGSTAGVSRHAATDGQHSAQALLRPWGENTSEPWWWWAALLDLSLLVSPYTDLPNSEVQDRLECAASALLSCIRCWPGLLLLTTTKLPRPPPLQSLVDTLPIPEQVASTYQYRSLHVKAQIVALLNISKTNRDIRLVFK